MCKYVNTRVRRASPDTARSCQSRSTTRPVGWNISGSCVVSAVYASSGFRVQGSGFRVQGSGFRVRVWGLGSRI